MATLVHKSIILLAFVSFVSATEPDIRCPDPNSYFSPCGDIHPVTCANKDKLRISTGECLKSGGCVCKDGYVRNYRGLCILPEDCPVCGENEVFACGSACDTTCETLGEICPIVNIMCNEMCYCIDGYARNSANVCIPIKQCPPKTCPGKNEIYNLCPPSCPELTCETFLAGVVYNNPLDPETRICTPRCECKEGFVRKIANGECIRSFLCDGLSKINE